MAVIGSGGAVGQAGDLIKPTPSGVTVTATIQWPNWVDVDTLHVYMNTPNTAVGAGPDGNPTQPTPYATVDLRPLITSQTAQSGLPFFQAVVSVPVTTPSGSDAWILLDVDSERPGARTLFPVIPVGTSNANGVRPYALYNAVFIDGNGNGTYDAPGVTLTAASPALAPRALRHFTPEEVKALTPDVRAQFEAIARGQCHGEATNGTPGLLDHPEGE